MAKTLKTMYNAIDITAREEMTTYLRHATVEASERQAPVLTSVRWVVQMPRDWMFFVMNDNGPAQTAVRMFWSDEKDAPYVSIGATRFVTATGVERFEHLVQAMEAVDAQFVSGLVPRPRWFGGFSFAKGACADEWASWPEGMFFLPKYQFHGDPASHQLECVATVEVSAETDVDALVERIQNEVTELQDIHSGATKTVNHVSRRNGGFDVWASEVANTARDIRDGRYEKVVLARMAEHTLSEHSIAESLQTMQDEPARGFIFALTLGEGCFIGASPERLVRSASKRVSIDCLAGTAPRGVTPKEDEALADELFTSSKNREEHAVVARWVRDRMNSLVQSVEMPPEPRIKKLGNVQHLYTPLSAELRPGVSIVDVVKQLHPTPAVAGVPRQDALAVIRDRETFSRGWYAAPIGWLDSQGNGDFAVALRSALVVGAKAFLFAGAGIMGDSDPMMEWQETELKMGPMKTALGIVDGGGTTQ